MNGTCISVQSERTNGPATETRISRLASEAFIVSSGDFLPMTGASHIFGIWILLRGRWLVLPPCYEAFWLISIDPVRSDGGGKEGGDAIMAEELCIFTL